MSLDRLINLARRTGDRLIIHNPLDDHDMVIMSVDEYEELLDVQEDNFESLDDMAPWEEDGSPWHSAGSVLEDKYDFSFDEFDEEDMMPEPVDSGFDSWLNKNNETEPQNIEDSFGFDQDKNSEEFSLNKPLFEDFSIEENIIEPLTEVPYKPNLDLDLEDWQEEPLSGDEPVFYEEPV